jgi:hypothetical protein
MEHKRIALTIVLLFVCSPYWSTANGDPVTGLLAQTRRSRGADHHKAMFHNHLSRKVFDRACSASKDTIDEIIACVTNSEILSKALKDAASKECYKTAFNAEFDPNDVTRHKDLICNNRDKFETMTACIYQKTSEMMDPKQMEKFTETLVDVGLCIINALDS